MSDYNRGPGSVPLSARRGEPSGSPTGGSWKGMGNILAPIPEGQRSTERLDERTVALNLADKVAAFRTWYLGKGRKPLLYHIGNLAADREKDPELDRLARYVYEQAEAGRVVLYQKARPFGRYDYFAKRSKR